MATTRIKRAMRGLGAGVFAGLVLSLLAPLPIQGQQPSVTANIDGSAGLSSKRTSQQNQTGMTATPEGFEKLKLGPGYLLQMDVYDTPEMSMQLRIDDQGNVTIPLIGTVHLGGDTVAEAQYAIAKALVAQEILRAPQVTLNVVQFSAKNITVLGEVQSPGRIQLLAPRPLGDVLALVGGETMAAGNNVEIQHLGENGQVTTRNIAYVQGTDNATLQSAIVEPGDTIIVHRAGVIYVMGAVNRPGGYLMVNGGKLSIVQAISLAGGTTLQASTRSAVIVRPQGAGFVKFEVPLGKIQKGNAVAPQLELNDVLYVSTSALKTAFISGSGLLSTVASATIYKF
jgi:polysaccharide export outer membrane protein